jgi:hypothetical protein
VIWKHISTVPSNTQNVRNFLAKKIEEGAVAIEGALSFHIVKQYRNENCSL